MANACKSLHDRVARHIAGLPRSGIRDFFDIVAAREDVISLGIGEPDFVTPWHICESAVSALEAGATHYTSNLGLVELRKAICRYIARSYPGVSYDYEREVMVTVGVSEALDVALRAVIEPGDEVIYHEPAFVAYESLVRMAHGRPVAVETSPENGFGLTRDALEAAFSPKTKALLVNFPCNPTGAVLNREEARLIASFVSERDILLITDEVYSELTYDVERVSPLQVGDIRERTIFLSGFSKAWAMTGFRLGFVCAPHILLEAMMKVHQYCMMCAPVISQKAAIEALNNGDRDVTEMRESYCDRRNLIVSSFEKMGVPCFRPQGAFYAFPYIGHTGMTSHDFAVELLNEENVAVIPGSAFGKCGEGFVRCSYATEFEQLREAMERFARFYAKRTHG